MEHQHTHSEPHQDRSGLIKDIVIGMSDGLTVPFALAAGLSGAVSSNWIVTTGGIAEIIAGSIAMGLGGYLAGKTDSDHYDSERKREYYEVEHLAEKEKEEIQEIMKKYGISADTQKVVADELARNKDHWVSFMMKFELGLEEPKEERARKSAFNIAMSYVVGGFIPLSAYFFTKTPSAGLPISCAVTLVALLLFGFMKARATGQPPLGGALRTAAIGGIAAGAAFYIARLVSGAH